MDGCRKPGWVQVLHLILCLCLAKLSMCSNFVLNELLLLLKAISFDWGTLPKDCSRKDAEESKRFCETFCHFVSLLHALALQNLRRDWDLDNLEPHKSSCPPNMVCTGFMRLKLPLNLYLSFLF